ncbi:DUF1217 domain-containing protein [Rhizosaccharibacter radicis]|uniref:DUF1217 domain-containing protein n=1 Tax=Rhizosaccharibacter radicis TaxID=2782605 RepID=A0ABT1W066_9PROT|nr:DUF1217 domain-containing protein [Acetobacteraceae bacterium KSS12]
MPGNDGGVRAMSGATGGIGAVAQYLSLVKNEPARVAAATRSDPLMQRQLDAFTRSAGSLAGGAALLKNYNALSIVTGAFNMGGKINQTAVLKALLTQDPSGSNSLVRQTANVDYLHFARATQDRPTVTIPLGDPSTLSLATSGSGASTVVMQNASFAAASPTVAAPGVQWNFVLDDGSAAASIAGALTQAAQSAGIKATYTAAADGSITVPAGAPHYTVSKDSQNNTVFNLALGTDASGVTTKLAEVVSVAVASGADAETRTAQVSALQGAMKAAGLNVSSDGSSLSVLSLPGDAINGLQQGVFSRPLTVATSGMAKPDGRLALGASATTLATGQTLMANDKVIGTVQSVDGFGNVTLTSAPKVALSAGDTIGVASSASVSSIGTSYMTGAALAAGGSTLSLGSAAAATLRAGQVLNNGTQMIGVVSSVGSDGTVTLSSPSPVALAAGTPLVAAPMVADGTTPALSDPNNLATIVSDYETTHFEAAQEKETPGLGDALMFTRSAGSVTSISQLMSNGAMLNVVTIALGMGDYFSSMDYDQQVSLLAKKLDIKKLADPTWVKQTAEKFLIQKEMTTTQASTGVVTLFDGTAGTSQGILAILGGTSGAPGQVDKTDPALSLFA